ncbi:MAG TPA: aminoglycoside phosphotransferase family protein [Microlunatus sp.]|nr:aminoglycoside phosphotransferase family protein [Microlunatus sp.]
MIEVPATFRAMPRWWSDGTDWLDELPDLVAAQCRRWDLDPDGDLRHGSNALVVPVRRGAERWALRLSPPGDDVALEAAALRFWDGRGTVRLVDVDPDRRALLLEWVAPGRSLEQLPLTDTVPVIGEVLRRLAVDAPAEVLSTGDLIAAELEGWPGRWSALGRPGPDQLLGSAMRAAEAVREPATPGLAVNGDLHFGQILSAEREPWLVVDPVLLRGDIGYDLGRLLWSRLDELPGDDRVRDHLAAVVDAAGLDLWRAQQLVVVRAMSYLLWGLEHGLSEDPPRCRRLLKIFAGC